ncbi:MAG TPA: spore protease YyaC [Paenibacillus sp.]|jgi:putative sporulation protein YyaC
MGSNDLWEMSVLGTERRRIAGSELTGFFREIRKQHEEEKMTFLCIGTDRSTGDALGPLVGSRLEEQGFVNVVGTLQHPCDADNFEQRLAAIPDDHIIVAIDASLGAPASVGCYLVSAQPLFPAQSVGYPLPAAGHYSVAAVVNVKGPKPYWTLQMTSLYKVIQMADEITRAIVTTFK